MIAVLGWALVIVVALIAWFCYTAIFRGAKAIFGIGRKPKEKPAVGSEDPEDAVSVHLTIRIESDSEDTEQ